MAAKGDGDIAAGRLDQKALFARIGHQRLDQPRGHPAPANRGRYQRMFRYPDIAALNPGQAAYFRAAFDMGDIFPGVA